MSSTSPRELSCDYCGLPVPGGRRRRGAPSSAAEPAYCCSGCRFAASVVASDATDGHVRRTLLKLGLGVFFAMNVMVFSMALWTRDVYGHSAPGDGPLAAALDDVFRYLALVFCLPVVFLLGEPLVAGVWQALRRRAITTDLLLLVGVSAAVGYSLWSMAAGSGPIYFDVAAMILLFLTLGRWFEAQGKLRSGRALDELARLLPERVHAVRDRQVVDFPRDAVAVGDVLRVLPGERFAVDGVIISGSGEIDEQLLTGESRPVVRQPGDAVYSGTPNVDGDLQLAVTSAAGQETISRMLDLVRRSRRVPGNYERLADRVTVWFVPAVACVAVAAAWWHGRHSGLDAGILAGLAVALIACPCALGLATPLAVWIALGRAARSQVLFRNGQALERLAAVRAMLWDKTGTLTTGGTRVTAFVAHDRSDHDLALEAAAQLAAASNHSFSAAIRDYAYGRAHNIDVDEIRTFSGKGLQGRFRGRSNTFGTDDRVLLGSPPWLRQEGLSLAPELWSAIEANGGGDASLSMVGWGGRVRGAFLFREELRDDAAVALDACRRQGVYVAVATGDRATRAAQLVDLLQVPVLAEQLPEGKVAVLRDLRRRYGSCAMVGDGINDAPALAASEIGIAMSCGADLSRDSAAVCLLSNDLARVPWTIDLARQTVRVIRQNLCWAFSYNVVGIGLAASGQLSPLFAALSMVASSALVITNSLRLNRFPDMQETISDVGTQRVPGIADLDGDDPQSRVPSGCRNPKSELQLTA